MDSLKEFFGALGIVVGAVVLLGASLGMIRGSYNKARIQALREDNEDLRNRVRDVEDKCTASEAREALLEQKVEHMENENVLLTALVTQRANVDEVLGELRDHHTAAMDKFDELIAAVGGTA